MAYQQNPYQNNTPIPQPYSNNVMYNPGVDAEPAKQPAGPNPYSEVVADPRRQAVQNMPYNNTYMAPRNNNIVYEGHEGGNRCGNCKDACEICMCCMGLCHCVMQCADCVCMIMSCFR